MSFLSAFILILFGSGFKWDSRSVKALREPDCPCSAFSGVFHFGVMWGQCNWNCAKNAVANRKGQPAALVPQLWQLQTHKRERHKEGTVDQSNQKVVLKYSFLNQDVFLWSWAWSLSHLKLKHFILKQTISQLKRWKQILFSLILFCFTEWLQRSLQTNPKQFSSPPACLIHSLGSQMVSSQHANCKTHPLSLQGSCGAHMTDLRIKIARKKQQDQAVKMLTVCKRYRTTGYQRGLKS